MLEKDMLQLQSCNKNKLPKMPAVFHTIAIGKKKQLRAELVKTTPSNEKLSLGKVAKLKSISFFHITWIAFKKKSHTTSNPIQKTFYVVIADEEI